MITHRKPGETLSDYFTREYSLCMARVDKYYVLQSMRRDQGYFGAALFYQHQAALWYDRAMKAHNEAVRVPLRILSWVLPSPVRYGPFPNIDLAKSGADRKTGT